jgi:hypothetical protein
VLPLMREEISMLTSIRNKLWRMKHESHESDNDRSRRGDDTDDSQ